MTYSNIDQQYWNDLLAEEEQKQAAAEAASQLTPSAVGKAGPDFTPGASEQAQAQLDAYEQDNKSWLSGMIDKQQEATDAKIAVLQGVGDTAFGLARNIGSVIGSTQSGWDELAGDGVESANLIQESTSAVDQFWHKHNPQSDNGAHHAIRQISGVVLPSLLAPQATVGRIAATPWATALPGAVKTTGAIAARLGIDTTIVAASTTAEDENAAKALNDAFGWDLPWATREGAGPDERRKYQLYENMGFAAAGELLTGIFALRSYYKGRPKKNPFASSWIHEHDVQRWKIAKEPVAPGTKVEWDPGLVVTPKTDEAAAALTRNADEIAMQARSPAIREIDDQIERILNLESEALPPGRREEMLSELTEVRKSIEAEEGVNSPALKEIDEQIEQLGLLDELGEADEMRLAELVELRKRTEVDELPFDPLTKHIDEAAQVRNNSLADEAVERAQTNQGEYDPILHEPAEAQARGVSNSGAADPLGAVYDHHRIQHNLNTTNGRARAVMTTKGMRKFFNAADGTERGEILDEITAAMTPGKDMEAMIEGTWKVVPEEFQAAVDQVARDIHNVEPAQFAATVNDLKRKVLKGAEFLDTDDFLVYEAAVRQVLNDLDPDDIRASALAVRQAADSVASNAKAARILDGVLDTSRQEGMLFENLALVAKETRAVRYLWGYTGNLLDMAKSKNFNVNQLREFQEGFAKNLADAKSSATKFVEEMERIAVVEPDYLKAFIKAYDLTEGNVDDLLKLHRWAEQNVSLSKLVWDNDPAVKSLLVQGIHGVRYNSMLNGLAPLRAFAGNTILTVGKPVSVLAGSAFKAVTGDASAAALVKRALYTYGGVVENFQRAFKHMHREWSFAVANPEQSMMRGRHDVKFAPSDNFEVLESMAEGWRAEGKHGQLALLNMAKATSWYNNLSINRWGINALHSIDGFTNSMMASGMARAKAYDQLLDSTNGVIRQSDFDKLQKQLYDNAFDRTGLLTDEAAKHASQEIALNLDSKTVKDLDRLIARVPILKPLFMFPRTGVNGLKMAWSYNPLSALPEAIGKGNKVFLAKSTQEVLEVLRTHGITDVSDPWAALKTLQAEYRGRQVMGSAIVMGAGLMAVNGDLTGNGPVNASEKRDMMRMGWKPNSIRLNGTWYSYKGLEPYQQILSLTADVVWNGQRADSHWMEDGLNKIAHALVMNVSNQTFLSGMAPLAGLIGRDERVVNKFIAGWTDPLVPFYWSGSRSILNNIIAPQLKDVDNDVMSFHRNYSKFLFSDADELRDQIDVYTGQPINYHEPMTAALNGLLPFFKSNGGTEPWRQWLLGTGWNNLNTLRTNRLTGHDLTARERHFINTWVAKNGGLQLQIKKLMAADQRGKYTKSYVNARGKKSQKEFPISDSYIHTELDRMHTAAFKAAWNALQLENDSYKSLDILEQNKQGLLEKGANKAAARVQTQINDLLESNR